MQSKNNTKQRNASIQGLRSFKDTLPKNVKKIINKKAKKNIVENTPLQRIGQTQDIANTVSYLLSEKSDFTTGQTLVTDGGRVSLP